MSYITEHEGSINSAIDPIHLKTLMNTDPDFELAMKNKRTIESLENAADGVVAEFKIEADQIANKVKENLLTMRELASEHKFLFSDTNQLVTKDNEDLVAVIKTRISEHEAAEKIRLDKERERMRLEEERKATEKVEAEQREKEAIEAGRIAKEAAEKREQELLDVADNHTEPGTEICTNCGDIKRIGYICECSMDHQEVPCETINDNPEIKVDILLDVFESWWECNHDLSEYNPDTIAYAAFKAGVEFATMEEKQLKTAI